MSTNWIIAFLLGGFLFFNSIPAKSNQDTTNYLGLENEVRKELAMEQERDEKDERKWRESMKQKPDFAWNHYYLGDVLEREGKDDEAEAEFRAFLQVLPNSYQGHFGLGIILKKHGKYADAEKEFREVVRSIPDETETYFEIGDMLWRQEKQAEAEKDYLIPFQFDSANPYVHFDYAVSLMSRGKYEEAENEFLQAIHLATDIFPFGGAYEELAGCYAMQGKKNKAFESLTKSVQRGYPAWIWMMQDKNLSSIKDDQRFKKLVLKAKKSWEKEGRNRNRP